LSCLFGGDTSVKVLDSEKMHADRPTSVHQS
jgi:hypothetical protein